MNIQSEKVFYEKQVNDELAWVDAEGIIWGEDLYDSTIILYPKKITEIPGYSKMKKSLINAAVVFFDFSKEKFIRNTIVRYDWEERKLFITEGNFNALWKFLRNSVDLGIRLQKENGSELSVSKPEDIIDLSLVQKKGAEAVIKNGQLTYVARQIPESELKLQGRKQSLLDNAKYRFYYSAAGGSYHDKDCECVKNIAPESFMASEDAPEDYKPCKLCRRKLYLRVACSPYVKQIPAVDRMLHSGGIMDFNLEKYAMDYGLKFSTDADGVLTVKGDEDTWLIKGFNQNYLTLWHNNYARISAEERYITDGFHNQGLDGKKLYAMLEYINNYSFEKHLAAESIAIEETDGMQEAVEAVQTVAVAGREEPVAAVSVKKQGLIERIIARIRLLFAGHHKEDEMGGYITNAKYKEIILEIIRLIKEDTPKEELIQYLNGLISRK